MKWLRPPAHTRLSLNGIPVVPLFRTEHLVQLTKNLGDFSTPLIGSPDRVHNIRLSLEAINNTIVMPGEVFSFNGVVGERTPERGYRNAPIILGEAVVPGVGGRGVPDFHHPVQRGAPGGAGDRGTPHSLHCPELHQAMAWDAAVAWPYTDFKFRNDSDWPVIVKAEVQRWRVRVWILGREGEE